MKTIAPRHLEGLARPDESPDENSVIADGGVAWRDLSAFQRDILVEIARLERSEEDLYGLRIKLSLQEHGYDEVNHGRLYPNLDQLEDLGVIECGEIDRRTNSYTLTGTARSLIECHVRRTADQMGIELREQVDRVVANGSVE